MPEKTALVTGANGGLGTHVTKALLDAGFAVVGLAPKIQQSDFKSPSFTALPAVLDSLAAAKKAADSVIARFGKIDVLAHLVGGFAGGQTVADTDDATFQRMFDMNLNSAFHMLRAAIPHMRKAGAGRIIAVGSRAAEAQPHRRCLQRVQGSSDYLARESEGRTRSQRCGGRDDLPGFHRYADDAGEQVPHALPDLVG